jgi:hypothetical protein
MFASKQPLRKKEKVKGMMNSTRVSPYKCVGDNEKTNVIDSTWHTVAHFSLHDLFLKSCSLLPYLTAHHTQGSNAQPAAATTATTTKYVALGRHAHAGIGLRVKVPADKENSGGGQPGQQAPNANVRVPVGRQVAATSRVKVMAGQHGAAGGTEVHDRRSYAQRQKKDMHKLKPERFSVGKHSHSRSSGLAHLDRTT